jgi:hypothetical protein
MFCPSKRKCDAIDYDTKGKFFTNIVKKEAISAKIQTTNHCIEGNVHVRRENRFKDELDSDELFLAVTDAIVYGADGQGLFGTSFMAIRRSKVVWITPHQEIQGTTKS